MATTTKRKRPAPKPKDDSTTGQEETSEIKTEWQPRIHTESGLPCEMQTPKGTVLPFLMMEQKKKTVINKKDVWETLYTPYLQVAHRIVWFREEYPNGRIETDPLTISSRNVTDPQTGEIKDVQYAIFRATIYSPEQTISFADKSTTIPERILATATKHEEEPREYTDRWGKKKQTGFPDFIEKAETGSIGRALALCGYGTQFAPEFDEGDRLADAPIQPAGKKPEPKAKPEPKPEPKQPPQAPPGKTAEEQQDATEGPTMVECDQCGKPFTETDFEIHFMDCKGDEPVKAKPKAEKKSDWDPNKKPPDAKILQKVRKEAVRVGAISPSTDATKLEVEIDMEMADQFKITAGIYNIAVWKNRGAYKLLKMLEKMPSVNEDIFPEGE